MQKIISTFTKHRQPDQSDPSGYNTYYHFNGMEFTKIQKKMIQCGMRDGTDYHRFAKPKYKAVTMAAFNYAMNHGLDVELVFKVDFTALQIIQIIMGEERGICTKKYARKEIDYKKMEMIRKYLTHLKSGRIAGHTMA